MWIKDKNYKAVIQTTDTNIRDRRKNVNLKLEIYIEKQSDKHFKLIEAFNNHLSISPENQKLLDAKKKLLTEIKVENKEHLIPAELIHETRFIVMENYSGDWNKFFDDVSLYFKTFTAGQLFLCNLDEDNHKYKDIALDMISRRRLNKLRRKTLHFASVLLKLVGKGGSWYVSKALQFDKKRNIQKQINFIRNTSLVGKDGNSITMDKVVRTQRHVLAENLNIIDTMQKLANDNGWTWSFITITLDREFHPNPTVGTNSYNGVSPADSAQLLKSKWNRVRALLRSWEIKPGDDYHGVCASEAHKDGCLHLHIQIFHAASIVETLKRAFARHFPNMQENYTGLVADGDEVKLKAGAFKAEDTSLPEFKKGDEYDKDKKYRAKATSYILKYVMKSINVFDPKLNEFHIENLEKDEQGAFYNAAFRSALGIRGVSFFGLEQCMTKFRFLARNQEVLASCAIDGFAECIKENNLYTFIKSFSSMAENVYTVSEEGIKKFVGVKINGIKHLKRIFTLVKKSIISLPNEAEWKRMSGKQRRKYQKNIQNNKKNAKLLAKQKTKELIFGVSLLVNHNDSRKGKKTKTDYNWKEMDLSGLFKNYEAALKVEQDEENAYQVELQKQMDALPAITLGNIF